MIALVAIAVSAVGWLSYRNLEQALLPRARDRIETHSRLVATDLESYAASATRRCRGLSFGGGAERPDPRPHRRAASIRSTASPKRPGATGSHRASRPNSKPSPPMRMFRIIGVEDDGREIVRVDRSGPNGTVRIVPEEELQQERRSRLLPGNDPARPRTKSTSRRSISVAATESSRSCTGRRLRIAHADLRDRRQAVRHLHHQRRHAAGVRPRPVVGAAGRRRSMSSTAAATISFTPIVRANSARSSASRTDWKADFPHLAARPEQRKASREIVPDRGRAARTASRLRPPFWPAANGSASSKPLRTPSSWRRRRASGTPRCWSD